MIPDGPALQSLPQTQLEVQLAHQVDHFGSYFSLHKAKTMHVIKYKTFQI